MQNRPLRSVLYVPASNAKALAKLPSLLMDAVIVDLEDAVHPDAKADARATMIGGLQDWTERKPFLAVRINNLDGPLGADDLVAACKVNPDAIVLPKCETPQQIIALSDAMRDLEMDERVAIWAMIETPRALFNVGAVAELGHHHSNRLNCFVTGTNDLMKETGVRDLAQMQPWLMQIVLAARAGGLSVLDGVHNDIADGDGFANACELARNRGFDGKTLIHPSQIEPANRIFRPDESEARVAQAIVAAFALPENAAKGVIMLDGKMVERLHLVQAHSLLLKFQQTQ
jgi:citrate lyase subunit beta / citryl-CoA lyase